jgi:hypothetical protein
LCGNFVKKHLDGLMNYAMLNLREQNGLIKQSRKGEKIMIEREMIPVTKPMNPDKLIVSQYGVISLRKWAEKLKKEFLRKGIYTEIKEEKKHIVVYRV